MSFWFTDRLFALPFRSGCLSLSRFSAFWRNGVSASAQLAVGSFRYTGVIPYTIALQRSEEGVAVWVPGLPGCWSQGADEAEALANIKAAIEDYLAVANDLPEGAERREVEVVV